jgi:hypothetical protein
MESAVVFSENLFYNTFSSGFGEEHIMITHLIVFI